MKLPGKYGDRLHTINFRRVTSEAAISIDYHPKLKILEIEYKPGKVYQYLHIDKKIWDTFLDFANIGEGLGAYINQDFKKMIDENNIGYYELIVAGKHTNE
jgi:hypothetical protein